jgi:hypothetical protein
MKRLIALVPILLFVVLASSGPAAQAAGARVGMMSVDGTNGYLNGRRLDPREPVAVYDGDYVSTGPGTSVRIGLTADGYAGFIQLDQNTDPNLVIASACIVMNILKGQALVNAKNICLRTKGISGVTRSVVNLKAGDDGTVLTVVEGQVEVEQPAPAKVGSSERLVVLPDGKYHQYPIDAAEASRSTDWTQHYFTEPPPKKSSKLSKWLWGLGAAAVIYGVTQHGHDHDDDNSSGTNVWCCLPSGGDGPLVPTPTTQEQCNRNEAQVYATRDQAAHACPAPATSDAPSATYDAPPVTPDTPPPAEEPPVR